MWGSTCNRRFLFKANAPSILEKTGHLTSQGHTLGCESLAYLTAISTIATWFDVGGRALTSATACTAWRTDG